MSPDYLPVLSQSGGIMWHFFLSFKFAAIHIGTLHFAGGRKGPYAPCPKLREDNV